MLEVLSLAEDVIPGGRVAGHLTAALGLPGVSIGSRPSALGPSATEVVLDHDSQVLEVGARLTALGGDVHIGGLPRVGVGLASLDVGGDFGAEEKPALDSLSWDDGQGINAGTLVVGPDAAVARRGQLVLGAERQYSIPQLTTRGYQSTHAETFWFDRNPQPCASVAEASQLSALEPASIGVPE